MHEAIYNVLNDIKNAKKIIPVKDSFVLVLHCSSEKYKNGELKLWKNFKKEIYMLILIKYITLLIIIIKIK